MVELSFTAYGHKLVGQKYSFIMCNYTALHEYRQDNKIVNTQSLPFFLQMFGVAAFRYSANVSSLNQLLSYVCEHDHVDQVKYLVSLPFGSLQVSHR